MRINRLLTVPAVAAVLTAGLAEPAAAAPAGVTTQDRMFLRHNAQTDLAEISLGKYVADHTANPSVRRFATMVMDDHQKVLDRLRALAQQLKVDLPDAPNALQRHNAHAVKALSGQTMDRRYARNEISGHQMSIADTRREINRGDDRRVIGFARRYLPTAQDHLRDARRIP